MSTDPLANVSWPLSTARLTIRRVAPSDVEATWRYRRLPAVGEWIGWYTTDADEYRERFLDPARQANVLVIEHDGIVIGDVMVRVEDPYAQREIAAEAAGRQAEIGWSLDPAFTGAGFATEAARAVIDMCFIRLGLHRVHAACFAENTASWRLMERLGMRREAHTRGADLHRCGQWKDGFDYALLSDEWPAVAAERAAATRTPHA